MHVDHFIVLCYILQNTFNNKIIKLDDGNKLSGIKSGVENRNFMTHNIELINTHHSEVISSTVEGKSEPSNSAYFRGYDYSSSESVFSYSNISFKPFPTDIFSMPQRVGALGGSTSPPLKSVYLRQEKEELITKVALLADLSQYERMILADSLHCKTYENGQCVFSLGEPATAMFVVLDGQVAHSTPCDDGSSMTTQLRRGDVFSELALLINRPHVTFAHAVGRAVLVVIERESFERLVGPCIKVVMRADLKQAKQLLTKLLYPKYCLSDLNNLSASLLTQLQYEHY